MLIRELHAVAMSGLQKRRRSICIIIDRADRVDNVLGRQVETPARKQHDMSRSFLLGAARRQQATDSLDDDLAGQVPAGEEAHGVMRASPVGHRTPGSTSSTSRHA